MFDVGANVGNRLAAFRELDCKVIAIEPQPSCVKVLRKSWANDSKVVIVEKAVGGSLGEIKLRWSSDSDVLASASDSYIKRVRESGRFPCVAYDMSSTVEVTTLDSLIAIHGKPDFIKIDVEGFEAEVLKGLTEAPPCLSFEFTPEFENSVESCLSRCEALRMNQFNLSYGESMRFSRPEWLKATEIRQIVEVLRGDTYLFGDIYARKNRA